MGRCQKKGCEERKERMLAAEKRVGELERMMRNLEEEAPREMLGRGMIRDMEADMFTEQQKLVSAERDLRVQQNYVVTLRGKMKAGIDKYETQMRAKVDEVAEVKARVVAATAKVAEVKVRVVVAMGAEAMARAVVDTARAEGGSAVPMGVRARQKLSRVGANQRPHPLADWSNRP